MMRSLRAWFDNQSVSSPQAADELNAPAARQIDWLRVLPFIGLHLACLAALWTGVSITAIAVALALYALRMFAITGFYHRYFAHKAFQASRPMQFLFAVLGASAAQRGPLWWASHHRHHHAHADSEADAHSPHHHGFVWSHMGWFLARENFATRIALVPDLAKFPELRFLDRFDVVVPLLLALGLYGGGEWLAAAYPELGTNGWMLLVWGFFISTIALYHATFLVNSLAHSVGRQRYAVRDTSRNNFWLALLTFGEGWHNNHHRYPGSARQGFFWWEVDLTYYGLRALATVRAIRGLRPVPEAIRLSAIKESRA